MRPHVKKICSHKKFTKYMRQRIRRPTTGGYTRIRLHPITARDTQEFAASHSTLGLARPTRGGNQISLMPVNWYPCRPPLAIILSSLYDSVYFSFCDKTAIRGYCTRLSNIPFSARGQSHRSQPLATDSGRKPPPIPAQKLIYSVCCDSFEISLG